MQLIAKQNLRYASRDLKVGDRFEATDSDAKVLQACGKAEGCPELDDVSIKSSGASRGRYRRSDMRPED